MFSTRRTTQGFNGRGGSILPFPCWKRCPQPGEDPVQTFPDLSCQAGNRKPWILSFGCPYVWESRRNRSSRISLYLSLELSCKKLFSTHWVQVGKEFRILLKMFRCCLSES